VEDVVALKSVQNLETDLEILVDFPSVALALKSHVIVSTSPGPSETVTEDTGLQVKPLIQMQL